MECGAGDGSRSSPPLHPPTSAACPSLSPRPVRDPSRFFALSPLCFSPLLLCKFNGFPQSEVDGASFSLYSSRHSAPSTCRDNAVQCKRTPCRSCRCMSPFADEFLFCVQNLRLVESQLCSRGQGDRPSSPVSVQVDLNSGGELFSALCGLCIDLDSEVRVFWTRAS